MKNKRFAGKTYKPHSEHPRKRDAESLATKMRKKGYLVRVHKSDDGVYEVYLNLGAATNRHWGRDAR